MSLFKSPKIPEVQSVATPTVTETVPTSTEDITELQEEEKKKIKKGKARGTILTGPRGILTEPSVEIKTLLGE